MLKQPYQVFVHLSEARGLAGLSENHMSDVYAEVRVGPANRLVQRTEVKYETVNAVWEAKFMFDDVLLSDDEFKREKLSISVYDRNVFTRDELIGQLEFSLTNIQRQKGGQYDRRWFALTLPDKPGQVRGSLKLTTYVLRGGEESPHPDEAHRDAADEDATILTDPTSVEARTPYVLNVLVYRAHHVLEHAHLPAGGDRNPFVTVRFNGNTAHTPHAFNTAAPVWNMKLVLPFNMPLTSESVELQLWNSVGSRPAQLIGEETFNYYNLGLTHKAWGQRWVNLYSADYASKQVTTLGDIKSKLDASATGAGAGAGSSNGRLRSEYVGRVLVRMSVTPTERANQRLLVLSCNPQAMPRTVEYCLDVLLFRSQEVPVQGGRVKVEVTFGDRRAESVEVFGEDGVFSWMQQLQPVLGKHEKAVDDDDPMRLSLRIHGPADLDQLHDVVVSVYYRTGAATQKIGFLRLKPSQLLPGGRGDAYFVNGQFAIPKKGVLSERLLADIWAPRWYSLRHVHADNDNPQLVAGSLLMAIGFGQSAVRPLRVPRPVKRPMATYTLRCYIYQAANLLCADGDKVTSNPFLVVRFGNASYRTRTIAGTTFPFWGEWCDMGPVVADRENPPSVFLQLYHQTAVQHKLVGRTDILGKHALGNAAEGALYRYQLHYDPRDGAAEDDNNLGGGSSTANAADGDGAGGGDGPSSRRGDPEQQPYVLACFQLLPYVKDRAAKFARFPLKQDWLPQPGEYVDGEEVTEGAGDADAAHAGGLGARKGRRNKRGASRGAGAGAGAGEDGETGGGAGGDDDDPGFLLRGPFGLNISDDDDADLSNSDDDGGDTATGGTGKRRGASASLTAAAAEEDEAEEALKRGNRHKFTGENPDHVWWRPQLCEFACKLEAVGLRNLRSTAITPDSRLKLELTLPLVAGQARRWKHSVPADQLVLRWEREAGVTLHGNSVQLMEAVELNSVRLPVVNPNGVTLRVRVLEGSAVLGVAHVHLFQHNLVSMPDAQVPPFYQYRGYYDRRVLTHKDNKQHTQQPAAAAGAGAGAGAGGATLEVVGSDDEEEEEEEEEEDDEDGGGVSDPEFVEDDDAEGGEGTGGVSGGPVLPDDDDVAQGLAAMGVRPSKTAKRARDDEDDDEDAAAAAAAAAAKAAANKKGKKKAAASSSDDDERRKRRQRFKGAVDEYGNPVLEQEEGADQANTWTDHTAAQLRANRLIVEGYVQRRAQRSLTNATPATAGTVTQVGAGAAGGGAATSSSAALGADDDDEQRMDPPLYISLMAGRQVGFSQVQSSLLQVADSVQWRKMGVARVYFTSRPIPDMRAPPAAIAHNDDAVEEWRARCQELRQRIVQDVRDVDNLAWLSERVYGQKFIARLYVYEGKYLSPRESFFTGNQTVNPYLVVRNAPDPDSTENKRDKALTNELNPVFSEVFEMDTNLPEHHLLEVFVWNRGSLVTADELIGRTCIDVEDLVMSHRVHGAAGYHTLLTDQSSVSQGKLRLKLDILTDEEARRVRAEDLLAHDPAEHELRMVIWNTRDVRMPEDKDRDKDVDQKLYVTANFTGEYGEDVIKATDTAWYSSNGAAEWNWRMTWRFKLPCTVPRLKFTLWNENVLSDNEAVGECVFNLQSFFEQSMRDRKPISHRPQQWVPFSHPNFPDVKLGEACIELWLLTKIEAEKAPVGEAQDEPNQEPFLPNPHRNPPPWAVGTRGLNWLAKRKALLICICLFVIIVPVVVSIIVTQAN